MGTPERICERTPVRMSEGILEGSPGRASGGNGRNFRWDPKVTPGGIRAERTSEGNP